MHIMRMLVDRFPKNVRHRRWIQRPDIILALLLIVLAFFVMVQQRRAPKMRLQARAHITTPTDGHIGYLRIPDSQQWFFPKFG